MRLRTKVTILAVLALLVVGVIAAVQPVIADEGCGEPQPPCEPPSCGEGCTPGFWKQEQHFQYWPVPQDDLVQDYYDGQCLLDADGDLDLNGDGEPDTLLDALNYGGGKGLEGKARNLLRAAVASLLNGMTMAHQPPSVNIGKVNNAIAKACETGNTCMMEYWSEDFDAKNNQYCVFSPED